MIKKTGTVIDFAKEDGTWFTFFVSTIKDDGTVEYNDPEEGSGRVCLRSIGSFVEDYFKDRKTRSEFVLNTKTRAMERVEYTLDQTSAERKKYHADLWDYAIVAWENFIDAKGKEIECTPENKAKMMKLPMFDRFVSRCLKIMADDAVKSAEALNENL